MPTFSATYSPEDNKLRLYASSRLDAETYARVKAAGFKWAPKQDLFFAPAWSPNREDLLLELAGDIDDEDRSLVERAEERAERFEGYSENRVRDAHAAREAVSAITDNIPLGQPILVGHHSERHARRDQKRIEQGMRKAVDNWRASQYWEQRAAGAVRAAKYKERPDVRARRIRTIEADLRKIEKNIAENAAELKKWRVVAATEDKGKQHQFALHVANFGHTLSSMCFPLDKYPRNPPASQYEGAMGLWSALEGGVITGAQAAELAIGALERYAPRASRWVQHYDNRLAYERAMLAADGGTVTDKTEPEVGGAVRCWQAHRGGWAYIQKVNKVSVSILMFWDYSQRPCRTTVELDKIKAVMTKAEVEAARSSGRLVPVKFPEAGFMLLDAAPSTKPEEAEHAPKADVSAAFEGREKALKAGVKVVAVNQLFPTPASLARRMVELARICDGDRILEPSAGTGNILACLREPANHVAGGISVTAVEINSGLCDRLRSFFADAAPLQVSVIHDDFLTVEGIGVFDVVLMNPPFENGADIRHIERARDMLKPGGTLVAICADGPRQRRALQELCDIWEELPAGTFKEAGTMVNTALILMRKR